jgi:uncharacterized protein (TIGR02145 family)
MSRNGRIGTVVTVTWILAMVVTLSSGGNSSQLVGRWVIVDCKSNVGTIFGGYDDEGVMYSFDNLKFRSEMDKCNYFGFPKNMELLRNGSGIVDSDSKPWQTQDNRIYFMGSPARAFNYKITGATIILIDDNGNRAKYMDPSAAQTYAEKIAMEKQKKEMELEKQKVLRNTIYLTDSRDGKKYRAVKIGNQTWMAENLNYQTSSGSWCYENNNSNCSKYGRFYDWNTAKSACPAGWHLPTRQEWGELAVAAGGTGTNGTGGLAGKNLKATTGWSSNGNGTDIYGFSALPGGYRYSDGGFYNAGYGGYWWTATEIGSSDACSRSMYYYYDDVYEYSNSKGYGFSVRCLGD